MKPETKLARVLGAISAADQRTESTAAGIFAIITNAKVTTARGWDKLVRAAYAANGWNTRAGRPAAGDAPKKSAVPNTVRTYVTIVRQALRSHMRLSKYRTFTALRNALEAKQGRSRGGRRSGGAQILRLPAPIAASFAGVEIQKESPNGALFHDLGVVYAKLPEAHRSLLGRQLNQLLTKYGALVPGALGKELRKAA